MGASQSKSDIDEKVFYNNDVPIQFSQDVVNHLSDIQPSPELPPSHQSTLDAHIRARIRAEIEHLRKEEEDVRHEIEAALEKENLDKARSLAGEASSSSGATGSVKNSSALLGDLEELKSKVDKYHSKRRLDEVPDVKNGSEAVVECYKSNPTTPLNCWKEIQNFKTSVSKLEQQHLNSLH